MADRMNVWIQRFYDRPILMLQWIDPETGKRRSKSSGTTDEKVAEKKRLIHEHELNSGRYEDRSRMSWERFKELYQSEKLAMTGEKNQEKAVSAFAKLEEKIAIKSVGQITERTISTFAKKLREEGLAAATIAAYLRYLKAALRWAEQQKIITRAPAIIMPKVPKNTSAAKIRAAARLTTEEFERLLAASPNEGWRLLIALAWHCGLRREEAREVRGEHIRLADHIITIPKNKAGDVDGAAFITPELDEMLRMIFADNVPMGRLIPGHAVPNNPSMVSKAFGRIAKKAAVRGASKRGLITLHDLRRSFGSRWAGKVPAQVLQRMMRQVTSKRHWTTMPIPSGQLWLRSGIGLTSSRLIAG